MLTIKEINRLKALIAISIFLLCTSCQAQLSGKYVLQGGDDYFVFEQSHFKESRYSYSKEVSIGSGLYKIKKGKLVLSYQEDIELNNSSYSVINTQSQSDTNSISVKMKIMESKDSSTMNHLSIIRIGESLSKIESILSTDDSGYSSFVLNNKDGKFPLIHISFIGYHPLTINLEELAGSKVDMECHLFPALIRSHWQPVRTERIPLNVSGDTLTLDLGYGSKVFIKTEN